MSQASRSLPGVYQRSMLQNGLISNSPATVSTESLERAIMRTVLYSDCFDYPLTPEEVAHYLIEFPGDGDQVREILRSSPSLASKLAFSQGYVMLRGRESLATVRSERALKSKKIWSVARRYIRALSALPFIRMVAVTGALAMNNSEESDDVDVLIVTAPSRVWLARAFAVLVVRVRGFARNTLCPNYVVSQDALSLEPCSIYVAHEFVQMVPVYGCGLHSKMREANPWIGSILPNARRPIRQEVEYEPGPIIRALKDTAERLLSGGIGHRLEQWEMRRKLRKFAAMSVANNSVRFDCEHVKGHFDDHGTRVESEYGNRLREHRLATSDES
jgi:hypothetical protein